MLRSRLLLALLCLLWLPLGALVAVAISALAIDLLPAGDVAREGEAVFFGLSVVLVPLVWGGGIWLLVAAHYRQLRRDRAPVA